MSVADRFIESLPSDQNIVDLFAGEWSSRLPGQVEAKPGFAELFEDARVTWTADRLGPLAGARVLELGPLEGAHTYMFERLGVGSIDSIESNTRAFLKCLCVKEIYDLKTARFQLGSFIPYLEQCERYDLVFACGVLYHMTDPVRLLELVMAKADKVFVWTHYYDEDLIAHREDKDLFAPAEPLAGGRAIGSRRLYPEAALSWGGFSGGSHDYATWLTRDSIVGLFERAGFTVEVEFDHQDHDNGPAFALCARR